MDGQRPSRLTRTAILIVVGLSIVVLLATVGLVLLNWSTPTPRGMSMGGKPIEALFPILVIEMPVLGAIICLRRSHPVGWLFLVLGVAAGPVLFSMQYALYGVLTAPGTLPGAAFAAWLTSWVWAPMTALVVVLLLIFPTGRLPSPRWRLVVAIAIASGVLQAGTIALAFPGNSGFPVASPLAFKPPRELLDPLYGLGAVLWSAAMFAAGISLVARLRRARGEERQQLKWFVYAGSFAAVALSLSAPLYSLPDIGPYAAAISVLAFLAIPAAAGLAILRYRLYDIDLIINRTIVYGATVAVVGAAFVGAVLVFQAVLRPLTGGSEIAVAGSTLATLALVQPLRRRIQDAVDRRFYRSRYDAVRTLDAFTTRLRDEVDLDALRSDLLDVVGDTVRPAHAGVWLREMRP